MRSRSEKTALVATHDQSTASSSHTNYRHLGSEQLKERLINVQNEKRVAKKKLKRLKEKLDSKIEEGVELSEEDCNYLTEIFEQADRNEEIN